MLHDEIVEDLTSRREDSSERVHRNPTRKVTSHMCSMSSSRRMLSRTAYTVLNIAILLSEPVVSSKSTCLETELTSLSNASRNVIEWVSENPVESKPDDKSEKNVYNV